MKSQTPTKVPTDSLNTGSRATELPIPASVSFNEQPQPDIATQRDSGARLGHSFGAIGVAGGTLAIQRKLTVGAANDKYEDEADRVAGQVMRMSDADVQRKTDDKDKEEQDRPATRVMRKADATGSFDAGADVEQRITASKGGGAPLPEATRAFMEPRFGADFGSVRVHADAEAHQLNQDISARAFTTGSDIYFRQGEYSPSSAGGQALLAHELTHVVQQHGKAARFDVVQRHRGHGMDNVNHTHESQEAADRAIQEYKSRGVAHSPTEQHYFGKQKAIDQTLGLVGNRDKEDLMKELILSEKKRASNEYVFSHAAGPGARAFHIITKILISCIHSTADHVPSLNEFEFLRAPSTEFDIRTLNTPEDFLKLVLQKGWSDQSDEKRPVLSTNLSVFGDFVVGGSENTFSIYFNKGLFDVDEKRAATMAKNIFAHYGLERDIEGELTKEVEALLEALRKNPANPALYQIFVSDEIIDRLAYISTQSGFPLDSKAGEMYGFEKPIRDVTGAKDQVRAPGFTRSVLNAAQTQEYWKKFQSNEPQARLLMNPNFFATPHNLIRFKVFERDQTVFNQFGNNVHFICQKYIRKYLEILNRFKENYKNDLIRKEMVIDLSPTNHSISILIDHINSLPKIEAILKEGAGGKSGSRKVEKDLISFD